MTTETIDWISQPAKTIKEDLIEAATAHQSQLTKPPGSLGKLEEIAILLAQLQGCSDQIYLEDVHIAIFAGDHGIVAEGISAFPQAVTVEMIRNFANGGAAINVLAQQQNAKLEVINTGTATSPGELPGVIDASIAAGTANFAQTAAMTREQLIQALKIGQDTIARNPGSHLFIGGEMGIGNTTSAAALVSALMGITSDNMAGPGTGLDQQGVVHKGKVIQAALNLHQEQLKTPEDSLQYLGGFEIAALVGAYIAAAQAGIPILVDGFITSAAALCAVEINPSIRPWMLFSHTSAEPGHQKLLAKLKASPIIDLGMRLGEGSGAAVAISLLKSACLLHSNMATFASAGVSEKES